MLAEADGNGRVKASASKSSSGSSDNGHAHSSKSLLTVSRDNKRLGRSNPKSRGSSSGGSSDQTMEKPRVTASTPLSLTEKRPSITAEELTPIVLNQLQTTSKLKEENRKLRRGSRSSASSTPASIPGSSLDRPLSAAKLQASIDSGSESCGEESRLRTAEAFMSGIQSAIQLDGQNLDGQSAAGLSAELVYEVNSVLGKLMQSINKNDPSLVPLIVNLQSSLQATSKPLDSNRCNEETKVRDWPVKEVALSEFSTGNGESYFASGGGDPDALKIPWKIRAARKRAMKHHTTGMTKEEFAKIKQSLMQSSVNCKVLTVNVLILHGVPEGGQKQKQMLGYDT